MNAIALIIVDRYEDAGVSAPEHVDVRVVGLFDDEPTTLPRGVGFEELADDAAIAEGTHYVWED